MLSYWMKEGGAKENKDSKSFKEKIKAQKVQLLYQDLLF